MITGDVSQTYQGLRASYETTSNGTIVSSAEIPNNTAGGAISYFVSGRVKYTAKFNFKEGIVNSTWSNPQDGYYMIYDNDNKQCGYICQKGLKELFNNTGFVELLLNGKTYRMYAIGFWKKGDKFPIFEIADGKEIQTALLEKDCVTYDRKDIYHFFAEDDISLIDVVSIFGIYLDVSYNGNYGEMPKKAKYVKYNISLNKALKAKYDPSFKEGNG